MTATTENLPVTASHQMIAGWVPFDRLESIAQLAPIFHIRPTDKGIANTGRVNSTGDNILQANIARCAFGVDGTEQRVGIISDGVEHLANAQATGDLPKTLQVINNRFAGVPGNQDEGAAMLEIVHDLAPGAALAFADNGTSEADFANNIVLLREAGCTVICDDITYLIAPVYEDGVIAQTVDNIVNTKNIVYVSSAGNYHLRLYEGSFRDTNNNDYHEFSTGDEMMDVSLGAHATMRLVLQWNNPFGRSDDDYDLYLYDAPATTVLASSTDGQNGNDDPVEFLSYTNPNAFAITVKAAVVSENFESLFWPSAISFPGQPNIGWLVGDENTTNGNGYWDDQSVGSSLNSTPMAAFTTLKVHTLMTLPSLGGLVPHPHWRQTCKLSKCSLRKSC